MKNDGKSKKTKKSMHYVLQVLMASGLGFLLVCGIVVICLMLFSNLFSEPLIKPATQSEYDYANVYEGISAGHTTGHDDDNDNEQSTVNAGQKDEKTLVAEYTGGVLYAGGQAVADNFNVKIMSGNGETTGITDYECAQLLPDYRLVEGDNVFEFKYGDLSAKVTVNAVNVRSFAYPPSYILRKVDIAQAQAKVEQIESGAVTYEQMFSNIAFTGDSQIRALPVYNIISMARIVAQNGESYDYLAANFDSVVRYSLGTDALIVHYGINTLSTSAEERQKRINQYRELLLRLKEELPGTRIIVSGLFPVHSSIVGNQDRFVYITEYDYALFEMCMEIGVEYLSDSAYLMEHQEYFGQDGLHLTAAFYSEYWLKNIILTMGV